MRLLEYRILWYNYFMKFTFEQADRLFNKWYIKFWREPIIWFRYSFLTKIHNWFYLNFK